MDEDEEQDVELQIDIMKAQLRWDWFLTGLVILVGILIAGASSEVLSLEFRIKFIGPILTATLVLAWSFWSGWPAKKANELREKYARKDGKE